jgi:PepSY-associated TM region
MQPGRPLLARFARWHIWLGWAAAVPLLLWTFSGLWMVARPIEEVRGTALRAAPQRLPEGFRAAPPPLTASAVESAMLYPRPDRPIWIIRYHGNVRRVADGASGAWLPAVDAVLARRLASTALAKPGAISTTTAFTAAKAPIDLRVDRPSWQVSYADGLNVYVDAETGEILAIRSRQWRWFDFMWGLHIMDLETREDTHHPLLMGSALFGLLSVLLGTTLLFLRRRKSVEGR